MDSMARMRIKGSGFNHSCEKGGKNRKNPKHEKSLRKEKKEVETTRSECKIHTERTITMEEQNTNLS